MTHPEHPEHPAPTATPAEAWEARYREAPQRWSGRANATLVEALEALAPGRALELGCGEGADAVWLAGRGWRVDAVDISPTAVERARAAAEAAGVADRVTFTAADLEQLEPEPGYDLVYAAFLHSREPLSRTAILRRASAAVAPGGHLVLLSHAAPPPWSGLAGHDHAMLDAAGELAALDLGAGWTPVQVENRDRAVTAPDGTPATLEDALVVVRRD